MNKYTYIKNGIDGYYAEFDEMLDPNLYEIGETYEDFLNDLWVLLSDEQVEFHNEHPNATVEEVWNMELNPVVKYTYIKRDIIGYYVEFDEMFDPNLYDNLGDSYNDFLDNLWVLLSDEQVEFHNEHPNATVDQVWNMELPQPHQRTLEDAKNAMFQRIYDYDSSDNVNAFNVHDSIHDMTFEGWFTPEERSNYKSSIDAAKLLGVSALTFFIGDIKLEVTPTQAEYMLAQIQLYADQCFIVTRQHEIAVEGFETISEVDMFNYTEGYPNKITFEYPFEGVE